MSESSDYILEIEALKRVVSELTAKVQLLVELLESRGMLEDHAFTFPDGDVWKAADSDLDKRP